MLSRARGADVRAGAVSALRKYPVNNESRRMRGGFFDDEAFFLRASNRSKDFFLGFKYASVGFRVAWPVKSGRD